MPKGNIAFILLGVFYLIGALGKEIRLEPYYEVLKLFQDIAYRKAYNAANNYLANNRQDDDPAKDLDLIIDFCRQRAASTNSYGHTAEQIESLKELLIDCNPSKSMSIIQKNHQAIWNNLQRKPATDWRPIDRLMHHYFVSHSRKCLPTYQEKFKSKVAILLKFVTPYKNKELKVLLPLEFAIGYLNGRLLAQQEARSEKEDTYWIASSTQELTENILHETNLNLSQLLRFEQIPNVLAIQGAIKHLSSFRQNEPCQNLKYLERQWSENFQEFICKPDKILRLFENHISDPCKYFNDHLYIELEPLILEDNSLIDFDPPNTKGDFLEIIDYLIGSITFKLCKKILDNKWKIFDQLVDLVANRKSNNASMSC